MRDAEFAARFEFYLSKSFKKVVGVITMSNKHKRKYDRYFRFELVYDDEIKLYGLGFEEYRGAGGVIFQTSFIVDTKNEYDAIHKAMKLVGHLTSKSERVVISDRDSDMRALKRRYPSYNFRKLNDRNARGVNKLANEALDRFEKFRRKENRQR